MRKVPPAGQATGHTPGVGDGWLWNSNDTPTPTRDSRDRFGDRAAAAGSPATARTDPQGKGVNPMRIDGWERMERRILAGASPRHKVVRPRRGRLAECRDEPKGLTPSVRFRTR